MKYVTKPIRTLISTAVIALSTQGVYAGSFSLYTEGSAAAIGNYAAGIAAEAADASTSWYNPAGLVLIPGQEVVVGGIGVFPTSNITGTSTFSTPPLPNYVQSFNGLEGGRNAFIPNFHYALPLGDRAAFGLSMVAPFGLATSWSPVGPVRYAATYSKLSTIDISPALAAKVTDNFSVGAGVDFQYAKVKFNRELGSPSIMAALNPFTNLSATALDSLSYNKGDSFAVGFHAGAMLMLNDNHTRVGVNYQSQTTHKFHGYSRLQGPLATPGFDITNLATFGLLNPQSVFESNNLSSNTITLPYIANLSVYHDINESWAFLGSVVYTGWSSLQSIQLNNVAVFLPVIGQTFANAESVLQYRDTWRVMAGANYHINSKLMLRGAVGYDQTPTRNADRDVRIADADRTILAIGAHYQYRPDIGFDAGYYHIFTGKTGINKTEVAGPGSFYNVDATAKGGADIVGLQVTWLMDQPTVATK